MRGGLIKQAGALLCLGVGVTALAAGCGGNNSTTTTTASRVTATAPSAPATTTPTVKQSTSQAAVRYEQQMQALGANLSAYFKKVGQENATATKQQAIGNIKGIQSRLRSAGLQLQAIVPPPGAKADHEKLIAAVREYAGELNQIVAELEAGNREALIAMGQLRGIKDMGIATKLITEDGYDITGGPLSSG